MKATERIANAEIEPWPGLGVITSDTSSISVNGLPSVLKSYHVITTIMMTAMKRRYEKIFTSAIYFFESTGPRIIAAKTTFAPLEQNA